MVGVTGDNARVPVLHTPGEQLGDPLSPHVQQSLMAALARTDELFKRLDVAVTTPPADGSAAAAEVDDKSQAYAHDFAAMAIRNGLDHLLAWRSVLRAGVMPAYAHMSLLRTAYEAALLAYWLVEPGVDPATRHARGIAAREADYKERRKFEESAGITTPPAGGKLAVDRQSDLMARAVQLGMTRPNKNGDPVVKIPVPGIVELFDLYMSLQELQPKVSGVIAFTPDTPMHNRGC
jgi:hypothetical protein